MPPQCCVDDDRVLFRWQPDGAPLEAYFYRIVDVTIEDGHGMDGDDAAHSEHTGAAGNYAEFSWGTSPAADPLTDEQVTATKDECGNERRSFAVGVVGNFINDYWQTAGPDIAAWPVIMLRTGYDAVGQSVSGAVLYVLVYGRDIIISGSDNITSPDDALIHVRNVLLRDGTFQKLEVRGMLNSVTEERVPAKDGWIEIRVDGRIYQDGDDAATMPPLDPENPPVICPTPRTLQFIKDDSIFPAGGLDFGWQSVHFGPMGDIACLYIKAEAAYCNEVLSPDPSTSGTSRQDCDPPGPGGSSFNGQAQGPRVVHPGGYSVSYEAPTMGGAPATASNPTDAQTMTAATVPLYSVDFNLPDTNLVRWSMLGAVLVRAGAQRSDDRLLAITPPATFLADRHGAMRAVTWSITVDDRDGLIRGWMNSATNRYLLNLEVRLFVEDNASRLAGTARRYVTRGRIANLHVDDENLTVTFDLTDELSRERSPWSLDRPLPPATLGEIFKSTSTATGIVFLDDCPEETAGLAAPIILGPASDEDRLLRGKTPAGINPWRYVGDVRLQSGSERWHAYAVCLYAVKGSAHSSSAVFGSNLHRECAGSVRLDPDLFEAGGSLLVSDRGAWSSYFATPYIDVTVDGVTYRMTMRFGRGPVSDAHVNGEVPISENIWGVEHVGDASGTMITHAADVAQWMLDQPIFHSKTSGVWGSVAAFADGTAKVRTSSFNAARTIHGERLGSNYPVTMILGQQRPRRDWLAELQVGTDLRFGINHHGQVIAFTLDDQPSLANLVTFTDLAHIEAGSFKVSPNVHADLENWETFNYGPEPATGRTAGTPDRVRDTASIAGFGLHKAEDKLFATTRHQPMARSVSSRHVMTTREGIRRGVFNIDLAGLDLTIGQLIRVTHFAGIGTTGWRYRILLVVGLVPNPMPEDGFPVTVWWEDVHEQLVFNDGALPGSETARVGFHPVGSVAGGTAWTVGSVAAGTAYRVG